MLYLPHARAPGPLICPMQGLQDSVSVPFKGSWVLYLPRLSLTLHRDFDTNSGAGAKSKVRFRTNEKLSQRALLKVSNGGTIPKTFL